MDKMIQKIKKFQEYARRNPDSILRLIRRFKSSEYAFKIDGCSSLRRSLEVMADVYCDFYRDYHAERETRKERKEMHWRLECYEGRAEIYEEEVEDIDGIRKAIIEHVKAHAEIRVERLNNADDSLKEALFENRAILVDSAFYYIPEKIVRTACESILGEISLPGIKKALHKAGFLKCYSSAEQNYTTKKTVTVCSNRFRGRFLKISKDFFDCFGEMGLEEGAKHVSWNYE